MGRSGTAPLNRSAGGQRLRSVNLLPECRSATWMLGQELRSPNLDTESQGHHTLGSMGASQRLLDIRPQSLVADRIQCSAVPGLVVASVKVQRHEWAAMRRGRGTDGRIIECTLCADSDEQNAGSDRPIVKALRRYGCRLSDCVVAAQASVPGASGLPIRIVFPLGSARLNSRIPHGFASISVAGRPAATRRSCQASVSALMM